MKASEILANKGDMVYHVTDDNTVREAAQLMDLRRIGAVLVRGSDGQVCGVLSERDVARAVARQGEAALVSKVSGCMTRSVVTVLPDDTIDHMLEIMTDRRIRHLPVVEDDTLLGMISIGDVVKYKIARAEAYVEAMHSYISTG